VLVVGASGYLGNEVARLASATGHDVAGTRSSTLDITVRSDVLDLVSALRPTLSGRQSRG
jgi:dTDP-4-dehydrorhamnose reductase